MDEDGNVQFIGADTFDGDFEESPWFNNNGLREMSKFAEEERQRIAPLWERGMDRELYRDSVQRYTDEGFRFLNGELRAAKGAVAAIDEDLRRMVEGLEKAAFPTSDAMIVHRGTGMNSVLRNTGARSVSDLVGQTLVDHGYVSTASTSYHAADFIGSHTGGRSAAVWQIRVPKGTRVVVPDYEVTHMDEGEIILPRGSKFRIDDVKRSFYEPNVYYVLATLMP